ncbi:MAG: glycosyltransferase family 4 protein [Blastocatellia bacterium]
MESKQYLNSKIAFIHGRPSPHHSHAALANSVGAEFYFVDKYLRYHDLHKPAKMRQYMSWLLNSVLFPDAKSYDLFLTEGPHVTPVLMRQIGRLSKHQKIAALMADQTLFFLKVNWYSKLTRRMLLNSLCRYDALVCLSQMQADIATDLLKHENSKINIFTACELIGIERFNEFGGVSPCLDGNRLLFIGHGPSGWRIFYKGILTLLDTFSLIARKRRDATLTIIGEWDSGFIKESIARMKYGADRVFFAGSQQNLVPFFEASDLYLHLANGDAFPVATLEALRAGVPVIVSEWTGTREIITQIDERLVVPMDPMIASERIDWYFDLPIEVKQDLVSRGRMVMSNFSEDIVINRFRTAINNVLSL